MGLLTLDTGLRLSGFRSGEVVIGPLVTYSYSMILDFKNQLKSAWKALPDALEDLCYGLKEGIIFLYNHEAIHPVAGPLANSASEFLWQLMTFLMAMGITDGGLLLLLAPVAYICDQIIAWVTTHVLVPIMRGIAVLIGGCAAAFKNWRKWLWRLLLAVLGSLLLLIFAFLLFAAIWFDVLPYEIFAVAPNFLSTLANLFSLFFIVLLWWTKCPGRYDAVMVVGQRSLLLAFVATCGIFIVSYNTGGNFW